MGRSHVSIGGRLLAGAVVAVSSASPLAAQTHSGTNEAPPIVVTAQRRPEQAREVPISLTALSGEELENLQATDTPSLGKVIPSLTMMRTGAFTQPYLRGVGKRSTLGVENSVATYVDGVYFASSISGLLDLRGIERVEVLNGPQGTLFGRNTTGGVIQVITRNPEPDEAGEAEVHFGTDGYLRGDAYVTGGSDRLAGNLALSLSRNGGYGTNLFTGKTDQGEIYGSLVARSKWLWRPAGPVRLTLAGDYQDIDHDFSQRPVAGFPATGAPRVTGFRDGDQDASNRMHFRYGGLSARADADLGDLVLSSLSAWRNMRARYGADLDQGPQPLFSASVVAGQEQFSQELQLLPRQPSRFAWLAGLYFIHIVEQYEPTSFAYGGSTSARLGGRIGQTLFDTGKVSSYAAYAQGTLDLDGRTRVTGGLRYTIENRSVEAQGEQQFANAPLERPIAGLPLLTEPSFRNSNTFHKLIWRASLDRDLSDEVMGYLSVSRGFQSGGWNLQTPQVPAFAPETLDAFEGGLKYADSSGRFSADASTFFYDHSDLQVSAFTPIGSVTTNAASADIYGLELQARLQAGAGTQIVVGAQLLQAHFNRFPNATCTNFSPGAAVPYAPVSCDVTGNRLPFAPEFKFNAGATHRVPMGSAGSLSLSGNLAYNSGYFAEPDNVARQDAFATLDASAEWQHARNGLSIRLWATNLTNTHYYDTLVTFPTTGVLQRPALPRRVGVSIGYDF